MTRRVLPSKSKGAGKNKGIFTTASAFPIRFKFWIEAVMATIRNFGKNWLVGHTIERILGCEFPSNRAIAELRIPS